MEEEQPKIGMGDITKIIIAGLFSAIVFGPIGYFINDYLSKDNIKIGHVDFIPETQLFHLSQIEYDNLVNSTRIYPYVEDKNVLYKYNNWYLVDLLNKATHDHEYDTIDSSKTITIEGGLNR